MSITKEEIEAICAKVHLAYCSERLRQGNEPYWTRGDYEKLDENTKEYDRVTVRAVLNCIEYSKLIAALGKAEKFEEFALKLVEGDEDELKNLDYWAEEFLHAYSVLAGVTEVQLKLEAAEKRANYPIQDGENIPEWLAKIVYRGYASKYGNMQSYERIRERGGFGKAEVIWLLSETCEVKTIKEAEQALSKKAGEEDECLS